MFVISSFLYKYIEYKNQFLSRIQIKKWKLRYCN